MPVGGREGGEREERGRREEAERKERGKEKENMFIYY